MNNISRLTIPMDKKLRQQLKKRASDLGFDSSQALLRYVSKAIVDERNVTFGEDDNWGEPPEHVLQAWQKDLDELETDRQAGKAKNYTDTDKLIKDLKP